MHRKGRQNTTNVPLSNLGTFEKLESTNDIGRGSGLAYEKRHRQQQKKHPTEGIPLNVQFIRTVHVRCILEVKVPILLMVATQSFMSPKEWMRKLQAK